MNENKSYASPVSYARSTPAIIHLASRRGHIAAKTAAWLGVVPLLVLVWALLLGYYLVMFTVAAPLFIIWRLMRRSDRRNKAVIEAIRHQGR